MPDGVYGATIARETAVYYNWSPEQQRFLASIEKRSGMVHSLSDPQE
jgi:hypothetical protein